MSLAQCASPIIAQNCACKCSAYTPYNTQVFNNGYGGYGNMPMYGNMPGGK
nr:unnamed protein product [Meloidogyne enterolobii]